MTDDEFVSNIQSRQTEFTYKFGKILLKTDEITKKSQRLIMLRNVLRKDSLKFNFSTIILSVGANILKCELIRINYKWKIDFLLLHKIP